MDPLSVLRASYYIILFGIELEQVPYEVKTSLELVRTCHADLQYLIELRNELLSLLTRRPKVLERVNSIIEAAHKGLAEVCEIVEKCRPQANSGRTPFRSRLSWILLDSAKFRDQKAIVSRHHACVLAELNFLRQIALLAPATQENGDGKGYAKKPMQAFDNIALLGDLMGAITVSDTNGDTFTTFNTPSPVASEIKNKTMTNNAMVPHMSSTLARSGPPPPYSSSSHFGTVHGAFREQNPSIEHPSRLNPAVNLQSPDKYAQINMLGNLERATNMSKQSAILDPSNADGLFLLFEEHQPISSPLSTTSSTPGGLTHPWSSVVIQPHQPLSSISSNSPVLDGCFPFSSVAYPLRGTPSMVSLDSSYEYQSQKPSTRRVSGHEFTANDRSLFAHSAKNAASHSTCSFGNLNPLASSHTAPPILSHNEARPLHPAIFSGSDQMNNSSRWGFHNLSPTRQEGSGDVVSNSESFSTMSLHTIYNQGGASSNSSVPHLSSNDYEGTNASPNSLATPTSHYLDPWLSPNTKFGQSPSPYDTQARCQQDNHQLPFPTASSLHPNDPSNPILQATTCDAFPPARVEQIELSATMDQLSIVPQSRCNTSSSERSTQMHGAYYGATAVNMEPQELSSVRFDPDPVELP